jgi:thiosulfate dehydrogenase [quinone] large subunit
MEEQKYNHLQLIALVALRVLIGWHFLYEGMVKLLKPDWSAAGYLKQSKGVFAALFQWMAGAPEVLNAVNFANKWGLTLIGLALILGLLTRTAAIGGALMVLLYYLANPPFVGYFSSAPVEGSYLIVNKNLVEVAALFLIAVTHSGRYSGIDRILHRLLRGRRKRPRESGLSGAPA